MSSLKFDRDSVYLGVGIGVILGMIFLAVLHDEHSEEKPHVHEPVVVLDSPSPIKPNDGIVSIDSKGGRVYIDPVYGCEYIYNLGGGITPRNHRGFGGAIEQRGCNYE